jgi:hypothetical protein
VAQKWAMSVASSLPILLCRRGRPGKKNVGRGHRSTRDCAVAATLPKHQGNQVYICAKVAKIGEGVIHITSAGGSRATAISGDDFIALCHFKICPIGDEEPISCDQIQPMVTSWPTSCHQFTERKLPPQTT